MKIRLTGTSKTKGKVYLKKQSFLNTVYRPFVAVPKVPARTKLFYYFKTLKIYLFPKSVQS